MPEQLTKIIRLFLLFLALLLIQCTSFSDRQKDFDGPYIWRYPDKWKADYLYQGDYRSIEIDRSENTTGRIWLDDFKQTFYLNSAPYHAPADQYLAADKIIVISDVHGQYDLFLKILKQSGVVNRKSDWIWGRGVLVVLGDIFDRGAQVNECLWLIRKLEIQAEEAGGRVDFLLGNHEIMVVQGDLRYVNPKYEESAGVLNTGITQLYGIETEIGQWLRTRNTILKIGNLLFVHGGIHPELVDNEISRINTLIRENIDKTRDERSIDPEVDLIFGSKGPFWYRGYSRAQKNYSLIDSVSVEELLSCFKVEHIITGHTTVDEIQTLFDGKIIQIDAGIKNGVRGEALLFQQNRFYRISESGRKIPLF